MNKLKKWEVATLIIVVVIAFIISLLTNIPGEETVVIDPEQISYKNNDTTICEGIQNETLRAECIQKAENRQELEQGDEEIKQEFETASIDDKKLLAKAMLKKDSTMCEQIQDNETREKCYNAVG